MLSIVDIQIEKLHPAKNNPFKQFEGLKAQKMINSVRLHGIMQPLLVRPDGEDSFLILAGHERYRAGLKNNLKELPCVIWRGSPAAAMFDSNTCSRSMSDEENAALDEEKWTKEFIQTEILPKMIPQLIESYNKGELSPNLFIEIACTYPSQEQQLKIFNTFSITKIVEMPPDNSKIEDLENQLQKATKNIDNLRNQISQKDADLNRLKKEKDRLTENIEDTLEKLKEAKDNAEEKAMQELGNDVKEFKDKWTELSYKLKEKETEIENLQAELKSIANTESAYLSELNATKITFREQWNQREKDINNQINDYENRINAYSRPELAISRFKNISEGIESLCRLFSDFHFTGSAVEEMEKSFMNLVMEKAHKVAKLLNSKKQAAKKNEQTSNN